MEGARLKMTPTAVAIPVKRVEDQCQAVAIVATVEVDGNILAVDVPFASSQRLDTLQDEGACIQRSEYTSISVFKPSRRSPVGISFVNANSIVVVEQIESDSPFRATPLRCGDVVLSINQYQVTTAKLAERFVKSAEQWLTLTVYTAGGIPDHVTTVLNKRVAVIRLGIKLLVDPTDGALCVSKVDRHGLLAHASLLQMGDVVYKVNREDVNTAEDAMELLASNPDQVELETKRERGVVLVFRRAPPSPAFWWKCVGLVLFLVVVMFVVFFFAPKDHNARRKVSTIVFIEHRM